MKYKIMSFVLLSLILVSCTNTDDKTNAGSNGNDDSNVINYVDNKVENGNQFNFPGNYTPPELTIDGVKDEKEWENASSALVFGALNQAKMSIYRGKEALFCFFEVTDADIETIGENNGNDVTKSDSVEVYFDFKNDAAKKPFTDDIQINIGAHGKTRIFVGANGEWGSWNGLLDYEVKLDGTLNDPSDVDNGYTVELMVPYSQVGIDQNSTIGVAVGHVGRGKESTHDSLPYTWGGLVWEGSFVDPQSPLSYVVMMGNSFYSRGNLPIGLINLNGTVKDQNGDALANATVKIGDKTLTTDQNGKYEFANIDGSTIDAIEVSKDGYKTYTRNVAKSELRVGTGEVTINMCLIASNSTKEIAISGVVKNPVDGLVEGATITVGNNSVVSDTNGNFTINALLDNDLSLEVSKLGYRTSVTSFDAISLAGKDSLNVGSVSLFSTASTTSFGGQRGITAVDVEIYRGFDGIHFLFKAANSISNGDHIELFIDTKDSWRGRDANDYRIDFTSDGDISIVNFEGQNNIVSTSGIVNNAYLEGTTYYLDTMIPYSFLKIEANEVIGVSFGCFKQSTNDWDGWAYEGVGFVEYVAPEYTDQYCRIGLDNVLYRALSNDAEVYKVYGVIKDTNGNPITNAYVNNKVVNAKGEYTMYVASITDLKLSVIAAGYTAQNIVLTEEDFENYASQQDFILIGESATIKGTCNVEGAKVYIQGNPEKFVYVTNGEYVIEVPTGANIRLVFEAEGYTTITKAFGAAAIKQSLQNNTPITYNVMMVSE